MDTPLKVGIIGCGQIAKHLHGPDYIICAEEATIVAFCDIKRSKAADLAPRFAPDGAV